MTSARHAVLRSAEYLTVNLTRLEHCQGFFARSHSKPFQVRDLTSFQGQALSFDGSRGARCNLIEEIENLGVMARKCFHGFHGDFPRFQAYLFVVNLDERRPDRELISILDLNA